MIRELYRSNPELRAAIKHSIADRPAPWVHTSINDRADLVRRWAKVQEGGRVALVRDGMDCDCTQYRYVSHIEVPVSVMAYQKARREAEEWLDGPESIRFAKPSQESVGRASSDRALEAYEDGHPSRVTYTDLSW